MLKITENEKNKLPADYEEMTLILDEVYERQDTLTESFDEIPEEAWDF